MHDCMKALQVIWHKIPNVFADRPAFVTVGRQDTGAEILRIQANHLVAGICKVRNHDRAEIAVMSCY